MTLLLSLWLTAAAAESPLEFDGGLPLIRLELTANVHAWFVVDTGASGSTISNGLAATLELEPSGDVTLTTIAGATTVPTVTLDSLRLPRWPVAHRVQFAVHDLAAVRRVAPRAQGILGQDVLARYDYLIDYERRTLRIGWFDEPAAGVAMPLTWSRGRPVLALTDGRGAGGLVLDSGADVLTLEHGAAGTLVRSWPTSTSAATIETHTGTRRVDVEHHARARLGDLRLPEATIVRVPSADWQLAPEIGLLPAGYFDRVYVSARAGRAVVWPR